MKIYYIGSPEVFTEGASSIHVARMCEAFSKLGNEVTLMIPLASDCIDDFFSFYGVNKTFKINSCIGFGKGPKRHFLHGVVSFFKSIFFNDYDYIVTRNITFAFMASYIRKNIIVDIHHPPVNLFSVLAVKRFIKSKNIVKIVCNSQGTLDSINKTGIDKFQVLNNGVNLLDFVPSKGPEEFKASLNIPTESKIISYIGNTYPGRGIEKIVRLAKDYRNIYFLVVGGEKEDNKIYKQSISDGQKNLIFTDHVPHTDIPNYLMVSDILLIPYDEHFTIKGNKIATDYSSPIKLFEYLSARKPIVASNLPSFANILKNRFNALLINPDSYEDLQESINLLLKDPEIRNKLSNNAFELSKSFTWDNRVSKMLTGLK